MNAPTPTAKAAVTWPEPTTVAHLRWALSRVPGRVLRSSEESLTLAVSLPKGARSLPPEGGELTLQWGDLRGLHERRVAVAGYKGGLIHLAARSDVQTIQRRRFFRAPVTIDLRLTSGRTELEGVTLDLSEGGARATVAGDTLLPSTRVTATLTVGEDTFEVPGQIVRHVPRGRHAEVGVAFTDVPPATANVLRKQVFTAQVEARRNGQQL